MVKIKVIMVLFLMSICFSCFATETLLFKKNNPKIIRAVLSNKEIAKEVSILVNDNYKWVSEFIHKSRSEDYFEIQLIFEKESQEKRLVASYQKGEVIFEGCMQMKSDNEPLRKENPMNSNSSNKTSNQL